MPHAGGTAAHDDTEVASLQGDSASRELAVFPAPTRSFLTSRRRTACLSIAAIASVAMAAAAFHKRWSFSRTKTEGHEVQDEFFSCGAVFDKCGGRGFVGDACCQAGCLCIMKDDYYSQCEPPAGFTQCNIPAVKAKAQIVQSRVEALNETAMEAWKRRANLSAVASAAKRKASFRHRAEVQAMSMEAKARAEAAEKIREEKAKWLALTDMVKDEIKEQEAKLAELKQNASEALRHLKNETNKTVSAKAEIADEAKKAAAEAADQKASAYMERDKALANAKHKSSLVEDERRQSLPWLMAYADLVA